MADYFLDVCSGHLSADTWAWLKRLLSDDPTLEHTVRIGGGWTRYGWFVRVPEDMPEGLPRDLVAVLGAARAQDAAYVQFDADAEPSEGLPLHPDFLD